MSNEVDLRKQRKVSAEVTIDTAGLATEAKQDLQVLQLQAIEQAVDDVEGKLDNIIILENAILSELQDINKHVDNEAKGIIASSTTSVLIVASNTTRKSLRIRNLNVKKMCLSFVSPATLNDAIFLNRDEIWIEEEHFGNIYGIWDTGATGNGCAYEEVFE